MNIEPDIFDYLETTSLEPHDDYTSEITYKDQKIIWNRLKEQQKQLNKQKEVLDKIKDKINQLKKEHNKNNEIALDKLVYNTLELNEILELLEEIE